MKSTLRAIRNITFVKMDALRKKYNYYGDLSLTNEGCLLDEEGEIVARPACGKRHVADERFMKIENRMVWERLYEGVLEKKYQKSRRKFSRAIEGKKCGDEPPIYIIPRERGGPSYKEVELEGSSPEDIMFMPISKGFSMQGISTFCAGPIVGKALNVVNAAWKNIVCTFHISGGGKVDLKRKNFWRQGTPKYEIECEGPECIRVGGIIYDTREWLEEHKSEWYEEWNRWRSAVALCSRGYFHWNRIGTNNHPIIAFVDDESPTFYVPFVDWKKRCYIQALYDFVPNTPEFKFLEEVWRKKRIGIGLVHPMAKEKGALKRITREFIRELFDSNRMCCQPYVIAGLLLGVPVYEKGASELYESTSEYPTLPSTMSSKGTSSLSSSVSSSKGTSSLSSSVCTISDYDVTAYTDGACRGNGSSNSVGGWGYFIKTSQEYIEGYGGERNTTNNKMELTAMIRCMGALLKWVDRGGSVCIHTDSNYVKSGLIGEAKEGTLFNLFEEGWIEGWKKKGWKTANRKPVLNEELWKRLNEVVERMMLHTQFVTIKWVKGHNGDKGNEEADRLANLGCDSVH